MPRKSTRENKNIYQQKRETLGLSREKAAALLETISEDRIGRIETKNAMPHPDEVLTMARKYNDPSLCNHFCANQCPIGRNHVIEVSIGDLPSIVLETLASLNSIDKHKERFIEIAADCKVDESEIKDFKDIQEALKRISIAVEALRLWSEQLENEQLQ